MSRPALGSSPVLLWPKYLWSTPALGSSPVYGGGNGTSASICVGMRVDRCARMSSDMCVDMCRDERRSTSTNMCIYMCTDVGTRIET